MVIENDFFISPKFKISDWKNINLNKDSSKEDWIKAIEIFEDRIYGRFLNPIESIENNSDVSVKKFCGFSIMALDCLLIETMNQFYNGWDVTQIKNWKSFRDFFKISPFFSSSFNSTISRIFYSHIRCGILHQAQTKKQTIIRIDTQHMVEKIDSMDVDKGLILNRLLFHEALKSEINSFVKKIINPVSESDYKLRANFIIKMGYICKI